MGQGKAEVRSGVDDVTRPQRHGWYGYWWASHTFESLVLTVFMSRYLPSIAQNAVGAGHFLYILGIPIDPAALFTYTVSACALLLVVVMPVVGAIADRTGRKRLMLMIFGWLGAFSCAAMVFVGLTSWQLGTALFALAFVCYSSARVVTNSILPDLADAAERDTMSSFGQAAGYAASAIMLSAAFGLAFALRDNSALLARISLCTAGVWWAAFMLVPLRLLRHLPRTPNQRMPNEAPVLLAGFQQLANTLRHMRRYPLTLLFLLSYLIYYDGVSTLTTLASDYGQKELHLSETTLLTANLIVLFVAVAGSQAAGMVAQRWGAKRVIAWGLVGWIILPVSAYFLQSGNAAEFYTLAVVLAVVLGGTQALSRSLFSGMIPRGNEAEYFSLYEISSSGTSALGPLLFGLALQNTGSYRAAISSLIVFFVVGLALLLRVDARRAIREAGNPEPAAV